ncbi:fungal-specific transcription factor domain-containing protein [Leptodontidium sp. 2 PMI_412]|nr:fungal-specific transcription factor domain-containing protein [Leptodontidium sp. 2 PMI_412]
MGRENGSEASKKHISTACTSCRGRKVKCDGQAPVCSNCVLYKQRCEYNFSDKRKISPKKTIQSLTERIALLETILMTHGIDFPSDNPLEPHQSSFNFVSDLKASEHVKHQNSGSYVSETAPDQSLFEFDTSSTIQNPFTSLFENGHMDHFIPEYGDLTDIFPNHFSSTVAADIPAEPQTRNDTDDIMDQLSARIGSFQIAEDGQLRYFGATSNLHILQDGLSSISRPVNRSVYAEKELVLSRAGLDRKVDREFRRHLEDLYFQWEDPAIHVVDKEMYFQAQSAYISEDIETPFYSETLMNAICASGSSLTSRTDLGSPHDAAEFFSSRAKLLLEIEMDSPSIATVQALVIMSAIEAAFTRDARGWLYSGMAVRLSADLGLHLDLNSEVRQGLITARELEVRRTAFWGVFIHDNMWSLYVGRPSGVNVQDISISRPQVPPGPVKSRVWHRSSETADPPLGVASLQHDLYDPVEACADANVSLGIMMSKLSKTVYSGKSISDDRLEEFAAGIRVEFDEWKRGLPIELRVNMEDKSRPYLPHVLQLHMQFYAISILLYRPFFSRSLSTPESSPSPPSEDPRVMCITAAQSIVKLLKIYRKQHTLRRANVHIVHLVFTASLICVYNTYSNDKTLAANNLNDLQFCCQALGEIGEAYQNSMMALEVIICIKREWLGKVKTMARLKRRCSTYNHEGEGVIRQKKRIAELQGNKDQMPGVGEEAALQLPAATSYGTHNPQQSSEQFLNELFPNC